MSNLVERLRAYAPFRLGESEWFGPKVCEDAAAHIEAQEAENARLRDALEKWIVYDDLDEDQFAGPSPMMAYADAIAATRAALSPVLIEDGES